MKSSTKRPADFWIGLQTKCIELKEKLVEAQSSLATAHVSEIAVEVRPRYAERSDSTQMSCEFVVLYFQLTSSIISPS
jgi:hypothetical protein